MRREHAGRPRPRLQLGTQPSVQIVAGEARLGRETDLTYERAGALGDVGDLIANGVNCGHRLPLVAVGREPLADLRARNLSGLPAGHEPYVARLEAQLADVVRADQSGQRLR